MSSLTGNGYTAEWEAEAERRGLPNKKTAPEALPALIAPKNIALMEEFGVLTKIEMHSRYEVEMEHYSKILNIEALTMLEMARKQLLPAINAYMRVVAVPQQQSAASASRSAFTASSRPWSGVGRCRRHERRHRRAAAGGGCCPRH